MLTAILGLAGCGRDDAANPPPVPVTVSDSSGTHTATSLSAGATAAGYNPGNDRYVFDVGNHSVEELQALLVRIEEITDASPEAFDNLEIVMVLHGPEIDLFTRSNYAQNRRLVDLAAKLDAFRVVDMKVCETAINSLGIDQGEIPAFIESVPYAPDELQRLLEQGYINL